jgi:ABC-type multidrug transport system permease subunit
MIRRMLAVLHTRNLEFVRDRASFGWNIILPILLVAGLGLIFSGPPRPLFKAGILQDTTDIDLDSHPFLGTRYVQFVPFTDEQESVAKLTRHQVDLLFDPSRNRYWVNTDSPKGYVLERLLLQVDPQLDNATVSAPQIRYIDWLLPGILGMNMMFSCLFGVGYVVVRYRKNGFLKRLQATPLRAVEFISAQVISRLILIIAVSVFVFAGTNYFVHFRMEGSYLTLLLVAVLGAICLISLGLLVAARVSSEEFAGGMLNMITWPMMLLSGVWFSMEGANPIMRQAAKLLPLTHILEAARAIMLDGAGLADIGDSLLVLVVMTVLFVVGGTLLFRWRLE